jgi:hypothetical protein
MQIENGMLVFAHNRRAYGKNAKGSVRELAMMLAKAFRRGIRNQ